ncbi:hypothetical protein ACIBLA_14965 [Streptomyces sp. NPDC050433]|uniref:hypothetical protein n=1 Tax=Streptomyces sp. NPDC050433 TaxID=3365615 RepID=UPI0037A0FBA8
MISELVECHVHRIEAVDPYSDDYDYDYDYDETVARNVREQDADARPAIADPPASIGRTDVPQLPQPGSSMTCATDEKGALSYPGWPFPGTARPATWPAGPPGWAQAEMPCTATIKLRRGLTPISKSPAFLVSRE